MTSSDKPDAKTLREEINALFGVRWDTVIEWAAISWLSLWFWSLARTNFKEWPHGPFTGVVALFESLHLTAPGWLLAFIEWINNPLHAWLAEFFIAVAAVCCVSAIRSYKFSGLRTLTLISVAVALEIQRSFLAVALVLLFALISALAAVVVAVNQKFARPDPERTSYYYIDFIGALFFTRIVLLLLAPPVAPLILAFQLVTAFGSVQTYSPSVELNRTVIDSLRKHKAGEEVDPATALAAQAVIHLMGNDSWEAHRILFSYQHLLERPFKIHR